MQSEFFARRVQVAVVLERELRAAVLRDSCERLVGEREEHRDPGARLTRRTPSVEMRVECANKRFGVLRPISQRPLGAVH